MENGIYADLLADIVERVRTFQNIRLAGLSVKGNMMTTKVEYSSKDHCWTMEIRSPKGVKSYYHTEQKEVIHFLMKVLVEGIDRWEKVQLMH